MKKSILILGGSGFIGRNLTEYLSQYGQYSLTMPTRKELDLLNEDAVNDYLRSNWFDVIIHSAVYNPKKDVMPRETYNELDANLRMFYHFEKNQGCYGKMLYFGSGAEFDKMKDISNAPDDYREGNLPNDDYGLAKYIIAKSIRQSSNIYNLRVFGLFGKYENWRSKFISGACCKAIKNLPITIRQNVYFDYLYIDDFCKIVDWFIQNTPQHKEYNVVSGRRVDLRSLANIVLKKSKMDLPIYVCRDGLSNEYTASNTRLLEELGSFTFTPIEIAISELYDWYEAREEVIDVYSLLYNS